MKFVHILILLVMSWVVKGNHERTDDREIQDIGPSIGNGSVSLQMQFMVSVRHASHELIDQIFGNGHVCGGVILSRSHVLTAASCVEIGENRTATEEVFVIAGTRYRYVRDGSVRREARNITIHPRYMFDPLNNNLAIIELSPALPDDTMTIDPIEFSGSTVEEGKNCQIFGWGMPLTLNGPRELMLGNITIANNGLCGNLANRICAGPDFISGCAGDDGGPVVCDDRLYGLIDLTHVSYCNATFAGRHTSYINIADYYEWIVATMASAPDEDDAVDTGESAQSMFSVITLISSAILLKLFN